MTDSDQNVRLVAIINKRIETGPAMNALLHLGAGLTAVLPHADRDRLSFLDFIDKDGAVYPSISARSFIVLRGTGSEIARAHRESLALGLPATAFLASMTGQTYVEQLANTLALPTAEVDYYGVALFGRQGDLAPVTKRFSMWR